MIATVQQLSICECGFPVLKEDVPLGTEYKIKLDNKSRFVFICVGCHKIHHIIGVYAEKRGQSQGGFLPWAIFKAPTIIVK